MANSLKSATRRASRKSSKPAKGQQELKPQAASAKTQQADTAALAQLLGVSPDQLSKIQSALGIAGGALPASAASAASAGPSGPVVEVASYKPQKGASYPALQIWFTEKRISKKSGKAYGADVFLKADSFRKLLDILDDQADAILEQFEALEAQQAE